jgi:mono/diheme cytochrome c family protein
MPFVTRKSLLTLSILSGVALVAAAGFVWSGIYNIGADDTHTRPVYAVLQALRERSIDTRAHKLQLPEDLNDPARIRQGAGNYNAMCTGCHLGPGMEETELSKGLYPTPPNLAKEPVDAAEAFWVIKHGIKASGMPAWGKSMDDEYIWNMAAFLQALPKLNAEQYQALVASSGGHSHGGGETEGHSHAEGMDDHHDDAPADADHEHGEGDHPHDEAEPDAADARPAAGITHVHADGKQHVHAPKTSTVAAPAKAAPPTAEAKPTSEPAPAAEEQHEHDHQH